MGMKQRKPSKTANWVEVRIKMDPILDRAIDEAVELSGIASKAAYIRMLVARELRPQYSFLKKSLGEQASL